MKSRLLLVILTVVMVGAGFAVGVWTERQQVVPPPPMPFMGEVGHSHPPPHNFHGPTPEERAAFAAELERMRPQIEEFRRKVDAIDAEFERDLKALLTPEQQARHAELEKRRSEFHEHMEPPPGAPKGPAGEQFSRMQQRPMFSVVGMVLIPMRLEWLDRELKFDATQRDRVRGLLVERRTKFLVLIDSTPPPSLNLSRLAPMAERLGGAKKED